MFLGQIQFHLQAVYLQLTGTHSQGPGAQKGGSEDFFGNPTIRENNAFAIWCKAKQLVMSSLRACHNNAGVDLQACVSDRGKQCPYFPTRCRCMWPQKKDVAF
jgi:hypothetical protein